MSLSRDYRNVLVLAGCQAMFNSGRGLSFLASSLAAVNMLDDDLSLVTLPIAMMLVGTALATLPAAHLMRRIGRKAGFVYGSIIGVGGGGLTMYALTESNFVLFNIGILLFGFYSGFAQQYRFAVADAAPSDFKAKAISLVLATGVIGAFVGPEAMKLGMNMFKGTEFLGSYAILIGFTLASGLIVLGIDIPKLTRAEYADTGRPLTEIIKNPIFIVAVTSAMLGFVVMSLLMTATPITMKFGNFDISDTAFVIEWHVVGMFAPGFFTGSLINRFGVLKIISVGIVFLIAAVAFAVIGAELYNFWVSMFLIGVGWNFTFTGGTTLLTTVYAPSERAKVQGFNDFLVFTGVALSSLFSGTIYYFYGWNWVVLSAAPMIVIMILAALWLYLSERKSDILISRESA